jgi:hypothetical protein
VRARAGVIGLLVAAAAGGLVFALVYAPADGALMAAYLLACGASCLRPWSC